MRSSRRIVSLLTAVSLLTHTLVLMAVSPSPAYAITLGEAQAASGRISAGGLHSLARMTDGTVIAWGLGGEGQTALSGMAGVTMVAAGDEHSLVLKSDGTVGAFGLNNYGQCQVPLGLTGVIALAAGESHSLALKSNGTVVAWGANTFGQSTVPPGLTGVIAISAGAYHSLALKSDGKVVAWGANGSYQCNVPSTLANVVGIGAGGYHSLALRSNGTVVGWGNNTQGQRTPPSGLSGVVAISAGLRHSLALKNDGTVVAWGGAGTDPSVLVPPGLGDVVAISAGWRHSLALKSDGTPVGWGLNASGQCLGSVSVDPAPDSKNVPTNTVIRIVYSAPVKAGDAYSQVRLEDSQGSPVATTKTINGTLLTVTPSAQLKTDERYFVRVPAGSLQDDFGTHIPGALYSLDTVDTLPPVAVSVVPANGETGVLPGPVNDVRLTFSEPVVLGANAADIVLSGPGGPVARTVGVSLGALSVTPTNGLAPLTAYTLMVPAGAVNDLAGNPLATTFTSSFTTGAADTTPPTVVSVNPANGATGVSASLSVVRVTMSEAILPGPNFFDIALKDAEGNPVEVHRWRDGNLLNITPDALLTRGMTYTLTVPAGAVTDLTGNALAAPFISSFTMSTSSDTTPPTVASVNPVHGATGVTPGPLTVAVTFSEDVVQGTNFSAIGVRNQAGVFVDRTLSLSGKVLSITPIEGVDSGTSYTVVVPVGAVKDLSGNALANSFTSSFTTAVVDKTPPTVISVTPANGATDVPPGALTIRVTFSEPIVQGAAFNSVALTGSGGAPVSRTLSVSGSSLLITSVGGVEPLTVYTLTVPAGAVNDVSGNALAAPFASTFTAGDAATPLTSVRMAGTDRVMTAVAVSKDTFAVAGTVIIATARNFPDALAAAPLANAYGAPILLVEPKSLPSGVASEITRLGATKAIIIGGEGAVSLGVEDALINRGLTIQRIAGDNRYDTAAKIALALRTALGVSSFDKAYIATGDNFPDALAAGGVAAADGAPILLVRGNALPAETQSVITALAVKRTVVLGGEGAVSASVASKLPKPTRVAGENRYETGVKVVQYALANVAGFSTSTVYLSTGENYPDALAAGAASAVTRNPIVLVPGTKLPGTVSTFITSQKSTIRTVKALGGETVVSDSVIDAVMKLLK